MPKKSLGEYLKENYERNVIDHEIRAMCIGGKTTFYIHPKGVSGDTLDFQVEGNEIKQM